MIIVLVGEELKEGYMRHETTVNLLERSYRKLKYASGTAGIRSSVLVSSLLNYTRLRAKPAGLVRGLVKYQNRCPGSHWHKLHVCLREDEYEFARDLCKVWKMSVSFIVADAIERYLDELIEKMMVKTDNYRYRNYASSRIVIHDVTCWIYYWGLPPNLLTPPD